MQLLASFLSSTLSSSVLTWFVLYVPFQLSLVGLFMLCRLAMLPPSSLFLYLSAMLPPPLLSTDLVGVVVLIIFLLCFFLWVSSSLTRMKCLLLTAAVFQSNLTQRGCVHHHSTLPPCRSRNINLYSHQIINKPLETINKAILLNYQETINKISTRNPFFPCILLQYSYSSCLSPSCEFLSPITLLYLSPPPTFFYCCWSIVVAIDCTTS